MRNRGFPETESPGTFVSAPPQQKKREQRRGTKDQAKGKFHKVEPRGQEPVAPSVRRNPPKLQSSFAKASEDTRIPPRPGDRGFLRRRVKGTIKEIAGKVSINPDLDREGKDEKRAGKIRRKIGEIEKVVGKKKG